MSEKKLTGLAARLANKTADIGKNPQSRPTSERGPVTMPGQLGAFRLEAQRYQKEIDGLKAEVEQLKLSGAIPEDIQAKLAEAERAERQLQEMSAKLRAAEAEAEEAKRAGGVRSLSVAIIDDSPYQTRIAYDDAALRDLAATIESAGQQEPLKVREKGDGRFELISGHRRLRAVRDVLGLDEIEVYVVAMSDEDAERATMLANESRENLTDYERAKLYKLAKDRGLADTQRGIAAYFGTSQATVSKCLSMLSLPEEYLKRLEDNPAALTANDAIGIRWHLDNPEPEQVAEATKARPRPAPRRTPSVITNPSGRQVFTARASGREIAVKINDDQIDAEIVKRAIVETLKKLADEADQKKESN